MAKLVVALLGLRAAACGSTTLPTTPPSGLPSVAPPMPPISAPPATATPPSTSAPTPTTAPPLLIDHPTGATDVVLRMWRSGGFLYPGTTLDETAPFTLYGDGRVIYAVEVPAADGGVRRELRQARLIEEQIEALLTQALGPGGLAAARDSYTDVPVADATTTNFEIHASGVVKIVAVYALGD